MILLLLFGFIAGAATAISPCALPVLPVVFAAGATGGRKRPAGIATGLALSFTIATVLLVYLISALGLPDGILRTFAITVLLVFGISLLIPGLSDRIEGFLSRVTAGSANKVQQATTGGDKPRDGFWSGVLIGSGLGLVYAPCAGPILAGVITVSASQDFSSGRLAVALAYGAGSAITFYALMLGGRKLITPLAKRSNVFQYAMGALMIFVALAMFGNLDTRFQTAIASDLPSFLVNPTGSLEDSKASQARLAKLRVEQVAARKATTAKAGKKLPTIAVAPDFVGNQQWFNTPGNKPLTKAGLRGKVYLIDFWTYTCINCIRTLPYVEAWQKKYASKGFTVVGVHSPEFSFEKSASNVQAAIKQNGLTYPVVQDNKLATWDAFRNQYWPAHYLIDANGAIRYIHYGEGKYGETERAIRSLLAENGAKGLGGESSDSVKAVSVADQPTSPETYLGEERTQGAVGTPPRVGTTSYGIKKIDLPTNAFRLGGTWKITPQSATAGPGAFLDYKTVSMHTYLVLGSAGDKPRRMQVLLDGKPISNSVAGKDVHNGSVTIKSQRLYRLVDMPKVETHVLTLRPAPGISGYAFTFG
jgi:cytochrome c biogenesis protein CcdA/thiol-disulfide isomerase/thioredoxin